MSQRRILVIGSQCEALQPLEFLPRAAQDLYAVMTDPERGACVSALDGDGLIVDPAVSDVKDAIRTAYQRAAKDAATLFIAYIGHGEHVRDRYYLLPRNAQVPPTSETAVQLTNLIMETHDIAAGRVDGLAVLVDACYAGLAGFGAARAWVSDLEGTLRFEMLTAAADRPAADGCFSRTLARLLRDGVSEVPAEHLRCVNLRPRLEKACPNQVPQHPSYNPDEALWLAKNASRIDEPWAHTPMADLIQRLTLAYQATPDLAEVVTRSQAQRCLAVVGEAGRGKSALAAALAWPAVAEGTVPAGFVQAVAFLTEATTAQELARILAEQLARSVPRFREAQQAFAKETPYAEQQRLGSLERQVVGPLKRLAPEAEVRFVIDALERLATGARDAVMDALNDLAGFPFVRLIVTTRPDTELPEAVSPHVLAPAPAEKMARYLERRAVAPGRRDEVIKAAEGNWLVVRVLADLLSDHPDAEVQAGQLALGDAYEELLARCGANDDTRRVLSVMAAGGAGPVLPLALLCAASEKLGGVATQAGLRDELFRLRGLVTRTAAGTEREHTGLFHQTLVEHVVGGRPQEVLAAHRALADCIQVLAPAGAGPVDLNDPIQRYAFEREAEHLWALGETDRALQGLSARTATAPRDNLRRWRLWGPRVESRFGTDHPDTLTTRNEIAFWTGECGDAREALRLSEALLPDRERVLGADHPDTLRTRSNIAACTGQCGDAREALRLFQALLPDRVRVSGADHPDTLATRNHIASCTGECGDAREALRLSEALLPDQTRVLGADHPDTLTTRANIASLTGRCGDAREALRLFQALLPDLTRVLGADRPDTLLARNNIASWTGQCGDAREALRLFQALLPDRVRVLGADHPDTLTTRHNIAAWTGQCGDAREALRLFQALLPDLTRVLGADHPYTLLARNNIAFWTGECGDAREALRLFQALLPDQVRVLGGDHPGMLRTRNNIAAWTGECGDAREALRLFQALLPDQVRVLGADHPGTLTTRGNIAFCAGECGGAREALRLFQALLPDQVRVLGADHLDSLKTRANIAFWTGECGDAREALRLSEALLPDLTRVLGADHPDTLTTRHNVAFWTGQCGDAREALRLSEALLPDQARVLGADHPNTLKTRSNIATRTSECGDTREALRLFQALLPDQVRVLGADHPDTLAIRHDIAFWTGEFGDGREALRLFESLLPDRTRVLGADHPDTLTTRNNIAVWTGQCGDAREALRLSEALLPDRTRVLGADHPDTLTTRNNIAFWTGECGDAREALRLSEALLPDRVRVLGADHPDTLTTRNSIQVLRERDTTI